MNDEVALEIFSFKSLDILAMQLGTQTNNQHVSILPYMRHIKHNIYINGTTSVSKIINLHNSGVIRVLQTFGLIYDTERG